MSESLATNANLGGHVKGAGKTLRADFWWISPLLTFLGLSAFGIYTTWAALQGAHYWADSYLSPFYSPVLFVDPSAMGGAPVEHAWIGLWPTWWPKFLPASPAFFILIFPLSFRTTCYYYRKAYYRSFFATPPGCAVGAIVQKQYEGETALLLFQNLHRFTFYFAFLFIIILYYDAFASLFRHGAFGIGVGSLVLFINATLLGLYTCGCHSFRHLIGGGLNTFSCGGCTKVRHKLWTQVSMLNERHMLFAWLSLFWVGFSDFYVRMVSMGIWADWSTW